MKILEEKVEIKAQLLVQGQAWNMLDVLPHKHNELHFLLREYAFQFLVVVNDFAQPVIVSRNGFMIIPLLEPITQTVKYYVEDEKEAEKENVQIFDATIDAEKFYQP